MSQYQPTILPVAQVRPNMILTYNQYIWPNGTRPRKSNTSSTWTGAQTIFLPDAQSAQRAATNDQDELPPTPFGGKAAYSGQISHHAKKRLQRAINLLVAIAEEKEAPNLKTGGTFKFKVNFITLTLPAAQGSIKDSDLKKQCLDPWLKSMRRRYGLRSYVWRAERQYNGNIHFHITTDTYLPYDNLCNEWNHQLQKTGLIAKFKEKQGHEHPNSTDVHSVQQIENLAGYMVKYMSKDPEEHLKEENEKRAKLGKKPIKPENHPFRKIEGQPDWNQPIDGKVWDCSLNLKTKARCETLIDSRVETELETITNSVPDQTKQTDQCFLIFTNGKDMTLFLSGELLRLWLEYLKFIREYTRETDLSINKPPDPVSTAVQAIRDLAPSTTGGLKPYGEQCAMDFPF